MKALSLKQPFAELVVSGKKTIELRKWNTHFRGKFLIHSSKIPMKGSDNLPCGCIVGEAELVDVKKYTSEKDFKKDQNKHLASSEWGKYGFILKNAKRLKNVPCKGKLGFWDYSP